MKTFLFVLSLIASAGNAHGATGNCRVLYGTLDPESSTRSSRQRYFGPNIQIQLIETYPGGPLAGSGSFHDQWFTYVAGFTGEGKGTAKMRFELAIFDSVNEIGTESSGLTSPGFIQNQATAKLWTQQTAKRQINGEPLLNTLLSCVISE